MDSKYESARICLYHSAELALKLALQYNVEMGDIKCIAK